MLEDKYEFVIVSGAVNNSEDCTELNAEMDDWGEEGYRLVSSSTTVFGEPPHQTVWATMVLEKEAEGMTDPGVPPREERFRLLPGDAS